jgi:Zn-dependent protease with chaperone function/tellurite resistance protein
MDFFAAQDRARRLSRLMVAAFACTVLAVAAGIFLVLGALTGGFDPANPDGRWGIIEFLLIGGLTAALIGGASLAKISQYRSGGGGAVASSLGGKRVTPGSADPHERRLHNVVEEMALAAGMPVPEVYVLPQEQGINAFAAGYGLDSAAVGVTRGCLEQLDRDQLQGVIAHEFSHILNGDMRLNLRLAGTIFGIMVIALLGRILLRAGIHSGRGSRGGKGNPGAILLALGVAMLLLGLIGELLGRLLQAAVSRQREFLADAAAVQFTRNPDGIASALKRIGALNTQGRLETPAASGLAHLFFASCLRSGAVSAFATHPPLPKRIRAIDPSWDGSYKLDRKAARTASAPAAAPAAARSAPGGKAMLAGAGMITAAALASAASFRERLPAELAGGIDDPPHAAATLAALLLAADPAARDRQLALLDAGTDGIRTAGFATAVRRAYPALHGLPVDTRLTLLEIILPAVKRLPDADRSALWHALRAVVREDNRVDFHECLVLAIAQRWLVDDRVATADAAASHLNPGQQVAAVLLAMAALDAAVTAAVHRERVTQAAAAQGLDIDTGIPAAADFALLKTAIIRLRGRAFAERHKLLAAAAAVAAADGTHDHDETLYLRALALALECPIPPP